MSKAWEILEECGRLLSTPLQRNILNEADSGRLATLVVRARDLLWRSYGEVGFNNVYVSFNGGKDSVTVLHLYRLTVLYDSKLCDKTGTSPLNVVYFRDAETREFPEIESFLQQTSKRYNFSLQVIGGNWRIGIPKLPQGEKKAFVLGSRRSDFKSDDVSEIEAGNVENISFTRIHPIMDWTYGDVWNFIRLFSLEYCQLYDKGYTSIGSVDDTVENPHLRNPDGSYAPAYTLKDWSLERSGRQGM